MGELAKIRRILDGISADYDDKNDNGSASLGGIKATGSAADDNNHSTRRCRGTEQSSLEEDVGERIQRQSSPKIEAGNHGGLLGPSRSKKTRKVHVNEIDQLFDGFA